MAWRRTKPPTKPSTPTPTASTSVAPTPTDAGTEAVPGAGDPLLHDLMADDALLVELSQAFADDTGTVTIGAGDRVVASDQQAPTASDSDDDSHTDLVAGDPLTGAGAATDGAARNTIAIGSDDDLPDAAYLDDELQRDSAGAAPVFIDDDRSGDAVPAQDASVRGIEPRIRQRRIGVKRAESRRRLWWIGLGAAVLVVVVAVLAVLGSSLFAVTDVTVTGNLYTDADELAAIIDDLDSTPVLRVDTVEFEERLEALAWVDRARVRTDFPNSATVEITERVPVAAMAGADGLARVIDSDGRVLTMVEGQPVSLVWFGGVGTLDAAPGEFAPAGYSSAASLVTKLTPSIRSRLDYILVTSDGADLVLVLTSDGGPIEVRFGSAIADNDQIEKLVRLERTLQDSSDRPVSVIDVSTSEVTVR